MSAEALTCGKASNLEEKSISKTNFKIILRCCQLAEFSGGQEEWRKVPGLSSPHVFVTSCFLFSNFVLIVSFVVVLPLVFFVNLFLCHHYTNQYHGNHHRHRGLCSPLVFVTSFFAS